MCGWVCPDCSKKYNWLEDRTIPAHHEQSCENCSEYFYADENLRVLLVPKSMST